MRPTQNAWTNEKLQKLNGTHKKKDYSFKIRVDRPQQ